MIIDETTPINPMEQFSQTLYQQLWANNDGGKAALDYAAKFGATVGEYDAGIQDKHVESLAPNTSVILVLDPKRIK